MKSQITQVEVKLLMKQLDELLEERKNDRELYQRNLQKKRAE